MKKSKLAEKINEIDADVAAGFRHVGIDVGNLQRQVNASATTAAPKTTTSTTATKRVIGVGFGLIPIYEGQNPKTDLPGLYPNELTQESFTEKVITAFTVLGMSHAEATKHVKDFIASHDPRSCNGCDCDCDCDEDEDYDDEDEDEDEDNR